MNWIEKAKKAAKKKVIQVALKVMFRLRKKNSDKDLTVKIASIDELKQSQFKEWFKVNAGLSLQECSF